MAQHGEQPSASVSSGGGHIFHNVRGLKEEEGRVAEHKREEFFLPLQVTSLQPVSAAWNKTTFVCVGKKRIRNNTMACYYKQGTRS